VRTTPPPKPTSSLNALSRSPTLSLRSPISPTRYTTFLKDLLSPRAEKGQPVW